MKTTLNETLELLKKPGAITKGIIDYAEENLLDREAKYIIMAYYDALGKSSEFEDGDNDRERLNLSIQYYSDKFNSAYLFDKYVKINEFFK